MKYIQKTMLPFFYASILAVVVLLPDAALAQKKWTPELSIAVKRLSDLSFAPDNKQILYGINSVDVKNDVYLNEYVISDLAGENTRTLIEPSSHVSAVQWSPDGNAVAYLSSESGHNNIRVINADGGGNAKQITDFKTDISSFKWAPDAGAIAFVMPDPDYKEPAVENPQVFNPNYLWIVKLDGGNRNEEVTNLTAGQDFTVSDWSGNWAYDWAPDSRKIVFAHQQDPGLDSWTNAQLSVVDIETKSVAGIATDNRHWKYFPKYSPDGKWIAYINAPGKFKWSFLWDIKLVPSEGGTPKQLANSKNRLPFPWEWASDSKSLYYIENDRATYSFYRMPIDGKPPVKIFGAPEDLNMPGLNTYLVTSMIDVSGDNKKIVYIGQTYDMPPEVYISDIDSFSPRRISNANKDFTKVTIGKTELIRWRSLDNTEVEALLTYPSKADHFQNPS